MPRSAKLQQLLTDQSFVIAHLTAVDDANSAKNHSDEVRESPVTVGAKRVMDFLREVERS